MNGVPEEPEKRIGPGLKVFLLFLFVCGMILLLLALSKRKHNDAPAAAPEAKASPTSIPADADDHLSALERLQRQHKFSQETAAETVARRLKLYGQKQQAVVHHLAEHYKITVPSDVDRFFKALADGDWPTAHKIYLSLRDGDSNAAPKDPDQKKYWRAIQEAYGAAEQAQLWPPQQLLAYGNGILNSLPSGMVYLGGTDTGCFICNMLNATSDGAQHVTLTQNSLADPSYLDYLRANMGDTINLPTEANQQAAIAQYLQDAQSHYDHDQQHPDEPKQVLPGEDLSVTDGKVVVNGAKAVMAVNKIMVQDLVAANPGMSFGMEDSFPIGSSFPGSTPLGPILALNNGDNNGGLTAEGANLAVGHWQDVAQSLATSPDALNSSATLISYAHDAAVQGDLLANQHYPTQAEQAYQSALTISPNCLDAALGLAKVLAAQGQTAQANQALNNFAANNPQQQTAIANFRSAYLSVK